MKCKLDWCMSETTKPLRGRPPRYCDAHKNNQRFAPARLTCAGCQAPLNRKRAGRGRAQLCLPCKDSRKAARNNANVRRWRRANPATHRAQQKRHYLRMREATGPLPPSNCVECGMATNRGPMALRCRPCLRRHMKLRGKYGIGISDYSRMLVAQDGRCAICHGEPNGHGDLHVDHDHATGRVRGLLCANCNLGLGNLRDSADLLLAAHAYLTR